MKHLAIIMDGNRRWAKKRKMPAIFWHKAGFDNVQKITREAKYAGIEYLTLWALSTENFSKRDSDEISGIIKLIHHSRLLLPEFHKEGVKIKIIWDIERLPQETQNILQELQDATQEHTGIVLTIALVYGGQNEIIRATKKIIQAGIDPETLDQQVFRQYLDTSFLPTPDMIIRTWWDIRHSWFLLYDSAYSEYQFTDKKWPEFDKQELHKTLEYFSGAKRNFWK